MEMNNVKDWVLQKTKEEIKNNIEITETKKGITIKNKNNEAIWLEYSNKIEDYKNKKNKTLEIEFQGETRGSGACIFINENNSVPLKSKVSMDSKGAWPLKIKMRVAAESTVEINKLNINFSEEKRDLFEKENEKNDVLVICPNYPSYENLYNCAFAHSRVREYINSGLKVQVAVINQYNWYQTNYEFDGVSVFKGSYQDLKNLLSRKQYKVILKLYQ